MTRLSILIAVGIVLVVLGWRYRDARASRTCARWEMTADAHGYRSTCVQWSQR